VHFAAALPHSVWQTSDVAEHLPGIRAWLAEAALPNTPEPIELDVMAEWPAKRYDAAFTANTLHIMSWPEVQQLFVKLGATLADDAVLAVYGPFNDGGRFTSQSNAAFDAALRARAPQMGIRDVEAVDALARLIDLTLFADLPMPANNRTLLWRRRGHTP
jgi:hypothetical protein